MIAEVLLLSPPLPPVSLQKDKDSERLFQWQHCHLTQEPLSRPVVACQLGRLYNKEAVIRKLLDRKSGTAEDNGPDGVEHIKSLKVGRREGGEKKT